MTATEIQTLVFETLKIALPHADISDFDGTVVAIQPDKQLTLEIHFEAYLWEPEEDEF